MRHFSIGWIMLVGLLVVTVGSPVQADQRGAKVSEGSSPSGLEPVRGLGCYTYGDGETPALAHAAAKAEARKQAVESYRVYLQSASTVKNFQLEHDVVETASAAILQGEQVEKKEEKGREICITIAAEINPVEMDKLIQERIKAKDVAQAAQATLVAGSAAGLTVRLNKPAGRYVEGDNLTISVQSDRDGYLKLDYFQADGNVVHLVPNIYGGEAFIKAGQVYTFGAPGGREVFTIQGPFGDETIKAILNPQPFGTAFATGRNVEDSRQYLDSLHTATRGVGMSAGASAAHWAEAAVRLMTQEKAVAEYSRSLAGTRGIGRHAAPPEPTKPTAITGGVGSRPEEKSPRP